MLITGQAVSMTPTPDGGVSVRRLPLISVSEIKAFRRCPREHRLAYGLGIRPLESHRNARFGTLVHHGLEAWWKSKGERLESALKAIVRVGGDPYEQVKAEIMLHGYDARWGDVEMEVLHVEVEFRAPLVNPATGAPSRTYELGGKLDAVVRMGGRVYVVEHKTSGEDISPGSDYWRRLRMDAQVSTYFVGARALGVDPEACLYDVLGKPTIRPSQVPVLDADGVKIVQDAAGQRVRTKDGKKWRESADSGQGFVLQTRAETPEEFGQRLADTIDKDPEHYFARGEVYRLKADEDDAAADTWATARSIREAETLKRWPRNPDACVRYGNACAYWDVCTGVARTDDTTRFRQIHTKHEELAANG